MHSVTSDKRRATVHGFMPIITSMNLPSDLPEASQGTGSTIPDPPGLAPSFHLSIP